MKIITRYIIMDFLRYLLMCLAVLVFIYIVINLFDNLGQFLAKNVTMIDIAIYYLYLMPSYMILLIPVAAIMAVFFVFGVMAKNRELIALKTSGLNLNRLFVLILITGALISVFVFAFQETVGVWAQGRLYEHRLNKVDRRSAKPPIIRRNFFYYGEEDWVYFIRKFDGKQGTVEGVVLWEIAKENRIKKRIDAANGKYQEIWIFENVKVREFDTTGSEVINNYQTLEMAQLKERPEDFLKRAKPLEEMNFLEILRFVAKRSRAGEDVGKEEVELNYRFSYPIITIILLLIALPISVVLRKGGIAIGLGLSIVMAFLFWGLIQSCRAYGVAGLMDPLVAAWFPNVLFGIIGIVLMLKVPR